ncbi:MAG TPA: hypothetical protein VM050_06090 [Patescibacteria group bacterium]|nr:hypothetical protein [Patescibacteria group bacterium]
MQLHGNRRIMHEGVKVSSTDAPYNDETMKLIKLKRVTQEYLGRKELLSRIWSTMHTFNLGLRNEIDDSYWSENKIAFTDLERVPEFNQYKFQFAELERLLNINFIREVILSFRRLSKEKSELEAELGVSMDKSVRR